MSLTSIERMSPGAVTTTGQGLNRPECILAAPDGALYAPDWTRGIVRIAPDGSVAQAIEADLIAGGFLPNGIALDGRGGFLFANLGEAGGVWRVGPRGPAEPVATRIDGRPIPPANFVLRDGDRIWITISASSRNHAHFTADEDTGQILLLDAGGLRVVADGLTWTNELRLSPDRAHLYVNETFACRTTRFDLGADGSLSNKHSTTYPAGTFPDGLAVDADGGIWSACVVSNRLIRLAPDGSWQILFEDLPGNFDAIASAHAQGHLTRAMIVESTGEATSNISSLAFGGPDLRTLYLGQLTGTAIGVLPSPVAGLPMDHRA